MAYNKKAVELLKKEFKQVDDVQQDILHSKIAQHLMDKLVKLVGYGITNEYPISKDPQYKHSEAQLMSKHFIKKLIQDKPKLKDTFESSLKHDVPKDDQYFVMVLLLKKNGDVDHWFFRSLTIHDVYKATIMIKIRISMGHNY